MLKYFITLIILCCSLSSYSQNLSTNKPSDSSSIGQLLKYDANSILKGVKHSMTRPLHWKGDDYAKLGGLIGGTVVLSLADEEFNRFVERQRNDFPNVIRDFGWYFGSPQNYFMANAGLYSFGLFTKNEKIRKTSVLIISSSVTTGLIQTIGKNVIGRARPGTNLGSASFNPLSKESKYHSFPSGHTILSITMSHSIAKQFNNTWTKIGIYTIGAIAPISRLIDGAHWLTDIAFGTAISIIVVDCIDKFLFKTKAYDYLKKEKLISWNFRFSKNKIGITGTF